jgi:GAF domain-containing protein
MPPVGQARRRFKGTDDPTARAVAQHGDAITIDTKFGRMCDEPGDGVGGVILSTGKTFIGRYGALPKPIVGTIVDHQVMGLPIRWQERLLGYFAVSLAPPRTFSAAQIEVLELIARIAAIAIEHSRRQEDERRRSLRFELIARIAADIHREPDCDALLQRAADAIHSVLKFPNVDIPLVDPEDPGTLVVRIRGGSYKRKIDKEDRLSISGSGIMVTAVRERQTQLVNDVRSRSALRARPA